MQNVNKIILGLGLLACIPASGQRPPLSEGSKLTIERNILKGPVPSLIPSEAAQAIDTLDTSDPFVKLLLKADGTWCYIKDSEAVMSDSLFTRDWATNVVNPYKTELKDIPERVTIWLVDNSSNWCCPYQTKVYSKFGMRRRRRHQGVDLPLKTGTPVYSAFDGKVRMSQWVKGYGNLVVVRHANGLETFYGHLSERKVNIGDWVKAGDVIGLGGSTGRSTGPHLHFETRYQGYAFDPQWIADFETGTLRHGVFTLKKKTLSIDSKYVPESEDVEEEILLDEAAEQEEAARKAAEEAAKRYYTIKSGDTLSRIAQRNGTTVSEICRLNNITTKTVLKIGRKIRVR